MTIAELYKKLGEVEDKLDRIRKELKELKLKSKREGAEIADILGGTPNAIEMANLRSEIAKLEEERRKIQKKINEISQEKARKKAYEDYSSLLHSIIGSARMYYMLDPNNYVSPDDDNKKEKSSDSPKKGLRGVFEKFKFKNKNKENQAEKSSDSPKKEMKGNLKPMTDDEIMEKYGEDVIANLIKKEREELRKNVEKDIDRQKDYLARNPYDRDAVKNNIRKIEERYNSDLRKIQAKYIEGLKEAKEYVSEFGFDHFAEGMGRSK